MVAVTDRYERNQGYNAVTRWLHSHRFNNAIEVISEFAGNLSAPPRLVEIGCAHGKLFGALNPLLPLEYTGVDMNAEFLDAARARYGSCANFRVLHGNALDNLDQVGSPDVIVALETLEHCPVPVSFRIVEKVAELQPQLFVCSVPIEIGPSIILKNFGSAALGYVRHRSYSWKETLWAGTYQLHRLPPHGTGHKGFDWRWLVHTIRYYFRVRQVRRFPFRFLPTVLSTSVFIVAERR